MNSSSPASLNKRFVPNCIRQVYRFSGHSVMVWGDICSLPTSDLVVFQEKLTANWYINGFLHVKSFRIRTDRGSSSRVTTLFHIQHTLVSITLPIITSMSCHGELNRVRQRQNTPASETSTTGHRIAGRVGMNSARD